MLPLISLGLALLLTGQPIRPLGIGRRSPPPMVCSPIVGVWDGVFSQDELATLHDAGSSREHSFTAVFDRKSGAACRSMLESSLCALLTELGDDSRYLEYWCASPRERASAGTLVHPQSCGSSPWPDAGGARTGSPWALTATLMRHSAGRCALGARESSAARPTGTSCMSPSTRLSEARPWSGRKPHPRRWRWRRRWLPAGQPMRARPVSCWRST